MFQVQYLFTCIIAKFAFETFLILVRFLMLYEGISLMEDCITITALFAWLKIGMLFSQMNTWEENGLKRYDLYLTVEFAIKEGQNCTIMLSHYMVGITDYECTTSIPCDALCHTQESLFWVSVLHKSPKKDK